MSQEKNIHSWIGPHMFARLTVLLLTTCWSLASSADLLNRIEVYKENNVGVIHILLTRPVIYTHHFPPEHSFLIHIYFNDLTLDSGNTGGTARGLGQPSGRPKDEFMRCPTNDIVPVFWVSYNNQGSNDLSLDPYHLLVQFAQPVHYKITADADNRGFYIFVLSTDASATKAPPSTKDTAKERTEKPADPAPIETESSTTDLP